jgi:hypothetical protein
LSKSRETKPKNEQSQFPVVSRDFGADGVFGSDNMPHSGELNGGSPQQTHSTEGSPPTAVHALLLKGSAFMILDTRYKGRVSLRHGGYVMGPEILDDAFHAKFGGETPMITTDLQLLHQNWTFLGEGKVHVIFRYVEPNTNIGHANSCVDARLPAKICHNAGVDADLVLGNATESGVTASFEHRVLRLTKKKFNVDDILRDEQFLNCLIKPWLSDSFCSQRVLVSLNGAFLEGLKTSCYQ